MSRTTVFRQRRCGVLRRVVALGMLVAGSACTLGEILAAQTGPALTKGMRVRVVVSAADSQPQQLVVGKLVRLERDTVVLWTSGTFAAPVLQTVALGADRRVQIAKSHDHGGTGAALGAVFGALAGAVIGAATWKPCTEQGWACLLYPSQGMQATEGALVGAAGGAVLGLAIGISIRTEEWTPLQTEGVRVAIGPRAIGMYVAF